MRRQQSNNNVLPEKFCLGSANFGLNYGIKNNQEILTKYDIREIISKAKSLGIKTIDSAFSYGTAHARLSKLGGLEFDLVTKANYSEIKNRASFLLKLDSISNYQHISVLLHDSDFLPKEHLNDGLKILNSLKKDGLINKFGLSIYRPETLELIEDHNYYGIVQYPFNVFDRRMELTGWMQELKLRNVEQFARSIFMQGTLLMEVKKLPKYFCRWKSLFERWESYLYETEQTAIQASISHVLKRGEIDKLVIGTDGADQLSEIISVCSDSSTASFNTSEVCHEDLIEPFRWKLN